MPILISAFHVCLRFLSSEAALEAMMFCTVVKTKVERIQRQVEDPVTNKSWSYFSFTICTFFLDLGKYLWDIFLWYFLNIFLRFGRVVIGEELSRWKAIMSANSWCMFLVLILAKTLLVMNWWFKSAVDPKGYHIEWCKIAFDLFRITCLSH